LRRVCGLRKARTSSKMRQKRAAVAMVLSLVVGR
jgi:hypothetical protein